MTDGSWTSRFSIQTPLSIVDLFDEARYHVWNPNYFRPSDLRPASANGRDPGLRCELHAGAGPIITYSGGQLFGADMSLKMKHVAEFGAKRRFESDIFTVNVALAF